MPERCPPAEELGALVDGRLSAAHRERMMAHLNACEVCFHTFTTAVEFLERYPELSPDPPEGSGARGPG